MKVLIDMLHILLCRKHHESDMMKISSRVEERCYYYLENDISGCEELPDHLEWTETMESFITSLDFSSPEEALEFVKEALRISQSIQELVDGNQLRYNFIRGFLK